MTPTHKSTRKYFNQAQDARLRRLLSSRYQDIAGDLEEGVRYLGYGPRAETQEEAARQHHDLAENLSRQCRQLLKKLREAQPRARVATSWGILRGGFDGPELTAYLGTDAASPSGAADTGAPVHPISPVERWLKSRDPTPRWKSGSLTELLGGWRNGEAAVRALEALVPELEHWSASAGELGRRSRGPQTDRRLALALWTGHVMRQAGYVVDTKKAGGLAMALGIIYSAAGMNIPRNLYRDLRFVCEELDRGKAGTGP